MRAGGQGRITGSPGFLRAECEPLDTLIRNAYLLYPEGKVLVSPPYRSLLVQRIGGSSGWIQSELYTINARAETETGLEMMRGPMLQAVLSDRFKLKIHWITREFPMLELTVAKGGAKMQASKEGSCIELTAEKGPPLQRLPGQPPPIICGSFGVPRNGGVGGVDATDRPWRSLLISFRRHGHGRGG